MTTKIIKLIALQLIMIFPLSGYAENPFSTGWIYGIGFSHHTDRAFEDPDDAKNVNSFHPIIGWQNAEAAGFLFINSFGEPSITVGKRWSKPLWQKSQIKVTGDFYLGVVTGYKDYLPDYAGLSPYPWLGLEIESNKQIYSFDITFNTYVFTIARKF